MPIEAPPTWEDTKPEEPSWEDTSPEVSKEDLDKLARQAQAEEDRAWTLLTGPGAEVPSPDRAPFDPGFHFPRTGKPGTIQRGISETVGGLVEGALSPEGVAVVAGSALPGVREAIGGVLTAKAAEAAATKIKEAKNKPTGQSVTEAILATGLAPLPALGATARPGEILPNARAAIEVPEIIGRERQLPAPSVKLPETLPLVEYPDVRIGAERQLPAPRTIMPEFQESTLVEVSPPIPTALPAPGESGATAALLSESPIGPRTAGYRVKVPPFEERPPIDVEATVVPVESVENLRSIVKLTQEQERPEQPYQAPTVSTDLRQLEKIMQKNTVSDIEAWADRVIKDKLSGSSANPYFDPEFLAAAVVKGTVLVKRGVTDFAEWSKPMLAQFGRDIYPHLENLYKQAKEAAGNVSAAPAALPVPPTPANAPTQAAFGVSASPADSFSDNVRQTWRRAANEAMPNITAANREVGEAGVRSVTARYVGRDMGEIFADNVLKGSDVDPFELGTFAAEDNLRWREADLRAKAEEARSKGETEDAALLTKAANAVGTLVGAPGSPFQTHAQFMDFWARPEVKAIAERHRSLWAEQKDPLYRQANDLDPDTPLASRGLLSGMRVNMKAIGEGEASPTAIPVKNAASGVERVGAGAEEGPTPASRSTLVRQMATLKRKDPFANSFTGLGQAYEANYYELLRNGFGRELPVAAQHEFIRKLIGTGDAVLSDKSFEPELTLKGEPTIGRLISLKPWTGKFLQVRKSLASEYDNAVGLGPKSLAIHPAVAKANDILTKSSIIGLSEGTTHMGNLLTQVITGPGPTSNPLINGLLKAFSGRADLLYSIPRVFLRAMTASKEELVDLMSIGAAKQPYGKVDPSAPAWQRFLQKNGLGHLILDPTDKGVRLTAGDLYDNFAKAGWLTATETGKREFINQVGNYNKELQPLWLRALRDNAQPFGTAVHSFNVMGLRRMAGSAGIRDLTPGQRLAFAADIYGGWLGFVTLTVGLNYLINHNDPRVENKIRGPTGTKLGEVGWLDEDGKPHALPVARIAGYERGLRITGLLPAAESLSRGLGPGEAIDAAGQAITQTGLNYLTGPLVRAVSVATTGKTPSVPSRQEAPVMVQDTEHFNPLKTQLAANIGTALKEANPVIDSTIELARGIHEDRPAKDILNEIGKTQLSRYWPRTPSHVQSSEDFADIVRKARLNDWVDDISSKARREPEDSRRDFLENALDKLPDEFRKAARDKLKRKGAFKPEK